jgi:hypothetical protein
MLPVGGVGAALAWGASDFFGFIGLAGQRFE